MLTELIASEAEERLQELDLANQLLAAVPCTFFATVFSNGFCVFGALLGQAQAMHGSILDSQNPGFPSTFGSWDAIGVPLAYLGARLDWRLNRPMNSRLLGRGLECVLGRLLGRLLGPLE